MQDQNQNQEKKIETLTISKGDLYCLLSEVLWGGIKQYSTWQSQVTDVTWDVLKKIIENRGRK